MNNGKDIRPLSEMLRFYLSLFSRIQLRVDKIGGQAEFCAQDFQPNS
jgi:hypothetical protein